MNFLLHGNKVPKDFRKQIVDFINEIKEKNIRTLYTKSFYEYFQKSIITHNNEKIITINSSNIGNHKIDYIICFGGDGTILNAATLVQDKEIPIVGINTGRLGFLATISKNQLSSLLKNLIEKKYKVSNRSLLNIESEEHLIDIPFALNEISFCSKENTSMINIKVYLNDEYLNMYWADGLIISTPTGSTGYSLSCGGPIVMPESNNFIITPIAPHNLNVRPLVISDKNVVKIEIADLTSRKFLLSMDSRNQYIKNSSSIKIKKASYCIKLVEIESINYSKTLREKLLWGLDRRNYEIQE